MGNNVRRLRIDTSSAKGFEEWKIASPWLRLTAQFIDQGLVSFAVISAMALWFPQKIGSGSWFLTLALLWILVSTLTQTVFIWFYGNTPGKRAVGLSLKSGQPHGRNLGLAQSIVRSFTWWLGLFALGTGWCTILSRPDRRAWHDVAADSVVVSNSSSPEYPTTVQKNIGEAWIALIALFFSFFVILFLLAQMQKLHRVSDEMSYYRFDKLSVLDQQSWLILSGSQLTKSDSTLIGAEAKLSQLLVLFSQARHLPLGERFNFYKVNMEGVEDELCRIGFEKSRECQSAQLMVELLTPQPTLKSHPKALQGLVALQQIESLSKMKDQIKYIESNIGRMPLYSAQYFALRALEAKIYLKGGDIKKSKTLLTSEIEKISESELKNSFTESTCQAIALDDCTFDSKNTCLEKESWKNWNKGCTLSTYKEKFDSPFESLGFWWAQAKTSKIKNQKFSDWDLSKGQFNFKDGANSEFEKNVTAALDFVINIKLAPKNVLARERKIAPENPLWGWAQKQALDELGSQWSYIIYPVERKLLEKFSMIQENSNRNVASEPEPPAPISHLTRNLTIEH